MTEAEDRSEPLAKESPPPRPKVIDAQELFQGSLEIWNEHAGVRYRRRITRRNKLILQK